MYAKVTKLIQWKHVHKWLVQRINRLKPFKTSHSLNVCLITVAWNVMWLVAVYTISSIWNCTSCGTNPALNYNKSV